MGAWDAQASIIKPMDAEPKVAWFWSDEADSFRRSYAKAIGAEATERVFEFAKCYVIGYAFAVRTKIHKQLLTQYTGYRHRLAVLPGTVCLDATGAIDGVQQISRWRTQERVPHADYRNLTIKVLPEFDKGKYPGTFYNSRKNRDAYAAWAKSVITDHMSATEGLVVCKLKLIEGGHLPAWPIDDPRRSDDQYKTGFRVEHGSKRLCVLNWGTGIGQNHWKTARSVVLFDLHILPREAVMAKVQGLLDIHARHPSAPSANHRGLNNEKDLRVRAIEDGHIMRHVAQMGLRGNARHLDHSGVCGEQEIVYCGDWDRLRPYVDKLFPGCRVVDLTGWKPETREDKFLALMAPGIASTPSGGQHPIGPKEAAEKLGVAWKDFKREVWNAPAVQHALAKVLQYQAGRGRGSGSVFVRL
jgi:hypothetical protein